MALNFVFISLLFVILLLPAQVIPLLRSVHFVLCIHCIIYILQLTFLCSCSSFIFTLNFIALRRQSLFMPFLVSGPSGLFPVFCHRQQCCCEHTSTCPIFTLLVRCSLNDRLLFFVLTCLSLVTGEVGHLSRIH